MEQDTLFRDIERYLSFSNINEQKINELNKIIKDNSWIDYYSQCDAEIDGWIDFEREIYPVIELFEKIMSSNYEITGNGNSFGNAHINKDDLTPQQLRIARLWKKYITLGTSVISVKEPFASMQYGILKKKIMHSLREEFDKFIEAFEIYLQEFVQKDKDVHLLQQITDIEIDYVVSFNYTLTERFYNISAENVHHIHGMIREKGATHKNNMIMGVNERNEQNIDFIYFVKYFQRIQKKSGIKYKTFIEQKNDFSQTPNITSPKEYQLHIYGHSLDETDADIIKYMIGDVTPKGGLNLKANQVIIYYYNASDYEQKVINLIKLYGRSIVEEYMESEKFKFIQTESKRLALE